MKSHLSRVCAVVLVLCCAAGLVWAAEHACQKGTWKDVQVKRPKVVFGVTPSVPNSVGPPAGAAAAQETRLYVIETDTTRLELRENVTVDTPKIDALVGESVEFAIEKKTVWIKGKGGRDHSLSLVKESKK